LWTVLGISGGAAVDLAPLFVGDSIALGAPQGAGPVVIDRPDGRQVPLPTAATAYDETDRPGLYRISRGAGPARSVRVVAVNVPPGESTVAAMPMEQLERAGIPIMTGARAAPTTTAAAPAAQARRQSAFFAVLEAEQKPWRWAIAAALLLLSGESLLAARRLHRPDATAPEAML
jgi:hypothetical protein